MRNSLSGLLRRPLNSGIVRRPELSRDAPSTHAATTNVVRGRAEQQHGRRRQTDDQQPARRRRMRTVVGEVRDREEHEQHRHGAHQRPLGSALRSERYREGAGRRDRQGKVRDQVGHAVGALEIEGATVSARPHGDHEIHDRLRDDEHEYPERGHTKRTAAEAARRSLPHGFRVLRRGRPGLGCLLPPP
jgi:hypothetical protein